MARGMEYSRSENFGELRFLAGYSIVFVIFLIKLEMIVNLEDLQASTM